MEMAEFRQADLQVAIVALLVGHRDVELVEGEPDALEILLILHAVDEITTHDVCLESDQLSML